MQQNVQTYNKTIPTIVDTIGFNDTRYTTIYSDAVSTNFSSNINYVYQQTKLPGLKNMSSYQTSSQANINLNVRWL